mmetsp:Transcript_19205/g.24720  ORF Transcript_19205/g.24720 Transcript_19205/m.24720 type:complete len:266 (-) Transcript_19205:113-910(-)
MKNHCLALLSFLVLFLAIPGNGFQASRHFGNERNQLTSSSSSSRSPLSSRHAIQSDGDGADVKEKPPSESDSNNRRRFLSQTFGALSSISVVQAASANPSIISSIQGPIQDIIAPGHWIGQLVGLNSKTYQWTFPDASPEQVSKALVDVLQDLTPEQKSKLYIPNFDITRADSNNVHVRTWTKNEWLDSLDVSLTTKASSPSTTVAKASFYATGFLPTSIPGAPLINIGMAWMPFASPGPRGEMLQDFRLRVLESFVAKRLQQNN